MKTFGIRHFSPAGAYFVRQFLDKIKPDLVLIEGPADFDFLIDDIVSKNLFLRLRLWHIQRKHLLIPYSILLQNIHLSIRPFFGQGKIIRNADFLIWNPI